MPNNKPPSSQGPGAFPDNPGGDGHTPKQQPRGERPLLPPNQAMSKGPIREPGQNKTNVPSPKDGNNTKPGKKANPPKITTSKSGADAAKTSSKAAAFGKKALGIKSAKAEDDRAGGSLGRKDAKKPASKSNLKNAPQPNSHRNSGSANKSNGDSYKDKAKTAAKKAGAEVAKKSVTAATGIPPAAVNKITELAVKYKTTTKVVVAVALIPPLLIFSVLFGAIVSVLGGGNSAALLAAPYNQNIISKYIPSYYATAYTEAAAKYQIPWTVLAAFAITQTDQGRFSPYDVADKLAGLSYVDRAPKNTYTDLWASNFSESANIASPYSGASRHYCGQNSYGSYCGSNPPIGTQSDLAQGPMLIRTSVAQANNINPQSVSQSVGFIAKEMAKIRDSLVASKIDTNYKTDQTQADSMWALVSNSLNAYVVNPSGAGGSCTQVSAQTSDVATLVSTIWPCALSQSPNLYVVTSINFSKGISNPSYSSISGTQAINMLTSEAQSVAASRAATAATCLQKSVTPQGIFPLTLAQAKAYGNINRCDPASNVYAAAQIVAATEQTLPKTRSTTAGPFAPMLGGWLNMPAVFGSQLASLINSPGPYVPFFPNSACNTAINTWLFALAADTASPLAARTLSKANIAVYLNAASTPQLSATSCANNTVNSADPAFYQYVSSIAGKFLNIINTAPATTPTTVAINTGVTTTTSSTTASSPTTATVPVSTTLTTTTVPQLTNPQAPAILATLDAYLAAEAAAQLASASAIQGGSPIARLSLGGVGFPLPANSAVVQTISQTQGSSVVQIAVLLGGDYLTDTRGGGSLSAAAIGGGTPSANAIEAVPAVMLSLYRQAAASCPELPWSVVAGIGTVESSNGQSTLPGVHLPNSLSVAAALAAAPTLSSSPSSSDWMIAGTNAYGAAGPMQMGIGGPSGTAFFTYDHPVPADSVATPAQPGNSDPPNPWNPIDAVYAATRMLCSDMHASSGAVNITNAIFAYNHSSSYVAQVLSLANMYASNSSVSSAALSQVVAFAAANLGVTYTWGGSNSTNGFDCSGLVQAALATLSPPISLAHNAQLQYDQTTPAIPNSQLQPGDLLFFGSSLSNIVHVGIYVGKNTMIDAPHTGAVVREENYTNWGNFLVATSPTNAHRLPPGSVAVA